MLLVEVASPRGEESRNTAKSATHARGTAKFTANATPKGNRPDQLPYDGRLGHMGRVAMGRRNQLQARTTVRRLSLVAGFLLILSTSIKLGELRSGAQEVRNVFGAAQNSRLPKNADRCSDCHNAPWTGGSSAVAVVRVPLSLPKARQTGISQVRHVMNESAELGDMPTGALRVSLNLLGVGLVEGVPDSELKAIAAKQALETHGVIHGQCSMVQTAGGRIRVVGRFGWKAQHASVASASAEALYSELGVPNELFPIAKTNSKTSEGLHEDIHGQELRELVHFLEASSPIEPDKEKRESEATQAGEHLFRKIGCSICHVETLHTVPSKVHVVPVSGAATTRSQEFHPYSDYLLHDIGTGDGFVENVRLEDYDPTTKDKFRTAPLWGVRFRRWLMHDGKSITYHQAIMRHGGEATDVVQQYLELVPEDKEKLRLFLDSL